MAPLLLVIAPAWWPDLLAGGIPDQGADDGTVFTYVAVGFAVIVVVALFALSKSRR